VEEGVPYVGGIFEAGDALQHTHDSRSAIFRSFRLPHKKSSWTSILKKAVSMST
jgi:hypothetical protein